MVMGLLLGWWCGWLLWYCVSLLFNFRFLSFYYFELFTVGFGLGFARCGFQGVFR